MSTSSTNGGRYSVKWKPSTVAFDDRMTKCAAAAAADPDPFAALRTRAGRSICGPPPGWDGTVWPTRRDELALLRESVVGSHGRYQQSFQPQHLEIHW